MNTKKILPYGLSALIGLASIVSGASNDKYETTIGGRTPKREKPANVEVKKSSPTTTLENIAQDKEVISFLYLGNIDKDTANETLNKVYEKVKEETGKDIDKERLKNWIIIYTGDQKKDITLRYNKDKGLYIKNTDNYFNTSNFADVVKGAQTQTISDIVKSTPTAKAKVAKRTMTVTKLRDDLKIGLGAENNNTPTISVEVRAYGNFWLGGQFYNETDPKIVNVVTKNGVRFNGIGTTIQNTKKDITSYCLNYEIPISKKVCLEFGGKHYIISAQTETSIEERLEDKNGLTVAKKTNKYVNSSKNEDNGINLEIDYNITKGLHINGYSVVGGKETRAGVRAIYAFGPKARSNLPKNKK